jgi:NTE family protein
MSHYPFRNLVFQGGGIKGFAYHGVIPALEEAGILPQIERVGGTSVGAMMATILSFRLSAAESVALCCTLDYSKVPGLKTAVRLPARLVNTSLAKDVAQNVDAFNRLLRHYGWYDTNYAYTWLQETVAAYAGDGRATFADFQAKGFRDLHIVATNLSRRRPETFSAETTPETAVADALLLSQSLPLFFAAPQFDGQTLGQGDYYCDGGILSTYPIHLFDTPQYAADNPYYQNGINWETVGCRFYTPPECAETNHRPITNLPTYIANLFEATLEAQTVAHEQRLVDRQRTVDVSNCGIAATDFTVQPKPEDEIYQKLVTAGETAVRHYLAQYVPPVLGEERSFSDHVLRQVERFFHFRGRPQAKS